MSSVMMECGHNAMSVDSEGNPACAICVGIDPGARIVAKVQPDLTGRRCRCEYYGYKCRSEADSEVKKNQFFEYQPDQEFDRYYCGCYGWD